MTVLAASLVGGVAQAPPAQASSITVETLVDLEEGDQVCSLREAIKAANTDAPVDHCPAGSGADTITFGVAGTIFLSGPLPWPTSEIVIDGGGDIVIDGGSVFQILYVRSG